MLPQEKLNVQDFRKVILGILQTFCTSQHQYSNRNKHSLEKALVRHVELLGILDFISLHVLADVVTLINLSST